MSLRVCVRARWPFSYIIYRKRRETHERFSRLSPSLARHNEDRFLLFKKMILSGCDFSLSLPLSRLFHPPQILTRCVIYKIASAQQRKGGHILACAGRKKNLLSLLISPPPVFRASIFLSVFFMGTRGARGLLLVICGKS